MIPEKCVHQTTTYNVHTDNENNMFQTNGKNPCGFTFKCKFTCKFYV